MRGAAELAAARSKHHPTVARRQQFLVETVMNRTTTQPAVSSDLTMDIQNGRLAFFERLYDEKFAARDRALSVALASMDRRLDGMNEFRDALRDQASRFLAREE